MPTATARAVKRYIRLKGKSVAKEFQKLQTEEWLSENVKQVSFSKNR